MRSKFEKTVSTLLESHGISFGYETENLPYVLSSNYKPDFIVELEDGSKIYVEAKGHFTSQDRRKMKALKEQHPDKDIRMWFMADNYLNNKTKATRYSDWAKRNGFKYHVGQTFPKEWFNKTTKKKGKKNVKRR